MECKTALRLMDVCRPSGDDLSDPELIPLTGHLEECSECLGRFRTRQAFDAHTAKAVRAVAVPSNLRERIIQKVDRSVIRARRRFIHYATAAAAAAILLVGTGLFFAFGLRTDQKLVIAKGHLEGFTELQPEDVIDVPAGENRLEQWCVQKLQSLKVRAVPPPQAMLAYPLVGVARANFRDRWVAVFRYQSASVFAWPQQQIEVNGLNSTPQQIEKTRDLTVVAWVEGDTVYVAVFRGGIPKEWEQQDRPGLT